jgi:hypothetical protein
MAVGNVAVLLHAERWVSQWKAAGGTVFLGQLPIGTDSLLEHPSRSSRGRARVRWSINSKCLGKVSSVLSVRA